MTDARLRLYPLYHTSVHVRMSLAQPHNSGITGCDQVCNTPDLHCSLLSPVFALAQKVETFKETLSRLDSMLAITPHRIVLHPANAHSDQAVFNEPKFYCTNRQGSLLIQRSSYAVLPSPQQAPTEEPVVPESSDQPTPTTRS